MYIFHAYYWSSKKKKRFKSYLFWNNIPYLWDDYWLRFTINGSLAQMMAAEYWSKVN